MAFAEDIELAVTSGLLCGDLCKSEQELYFGHDVTRLSGRL
jgi:hypothetical protein